jgi:hypothetical protein
MESKHPLKNENGLAVILAISLVGILSLFGVWLIQNTEISVRITSALTRNERAFNFAEGAYEMAKYGAKAMDYSTIQTENTDNGTVDVTHKFSYLKDPRVWDRREETSPKIELTDHGIKPGYDINKFRIGYMLIEGKATAPGRHGNAEKRIHTYVDRLFQIN